MGFMKQFSESVIAYLHDRVRDLYDFVSQTMHTQIYPNTFTKSTPLHLQIVNNTIMEKNKCGKKRRILLYTSPTYSNTCVKEINSNCRKS